MFKKIYTLIFASIVILNISLSQKNYLKEYHKRADSIINYYKNLPLAADAFRAMVKLNKGYDIENGLKVIDSLTLNPKGDMFWFYPITALYCYGEKNIPKEYKEKVKKALKNYAPYRGDTENHWTMYYVSLYLMAQNFPNEDGNAWYNGKSSQENFDDAAGWLNFWMKTTTTIGQGEFDSPAYLTFYVTPIFMLYQFSKDPIMKKKAEIMLNWLLVDFFIDYYNGVITGANSRIYQNDVLNKHNSLTTRMGAFFTGDRPLFKKDGTPWYLIYNAPIYVLSDYVLPEMIYNIGVDKSEPYETKEMKRSRNRIRFNTEKNPKVAKYGYIDKNYSMGCIQSGVTEQILQHTWNLNWKSDGENEITTFFTIHPYFAAKDMASLFTALRKTVVADVVSSKIWYDKEEKLMGSSPYEKLFQYKNTMIGLYDFSAEDILYKHYDGFFPKENFERFDEPSGWIFCKTKYIYIAFKPLKPYKWMEDKDVFRLRSSDLKNGFVLEVKSKDEVKSFDEFKEKIKSNKLDISDFENKHYVSYKTIDGTTLEFSYNGTRKINGVNEDPLKYKLFDSKYIQSEIGSEKMEIKFKNRSMTLDLKNAQIINK